MDADELRRRLMTDPAQHQDAADRARAEGGEAADVAAECAAFENLLDDAMHVDAPAELEPRLRRIPFRAGRDTTGASRPGTVRWLAIAASLTLALAVTLFTLRDTQAPSDAALGEFLAEHWAYDGTEVLNAAFAGSGESPDQVQALLAGFGVQLAPDLLAEVRLGKICPTPDGAGAHLVLETDDGPLTLYYMPRTQVTGSGESYRLADGLQAWVYNVASGSVALLTENGQDLPELGRRISNQLIFPDDRTL